ncbi:hypothetical protein BCO18442_05852 [Burkholderia contaminans]|nr:hypothetical protein BCO18442_05852 [Burkholderia contaminans]
MITTVKQLLANGRDDHHVRLQGRITKHVSCEVCEFADTTGSILIKMDHELGMASQPVNEKNEVKVNCVFERKWSGHVKVDADQVEIVRRQRGPRR